MPSKIKLSRLFKSVSLKDRQDEEIDEKSPFLMVLPPEIRSLIYEELIIKYILSTDPRTGRVRLAETSYNEASKMTTVLPRSSAETLPLVNRQIYSEYTAILNVALPNILCFHESRRQAKDRAMSLSVSNIKQRLREPVSSNVFNGLTHLVIAHKSLVILLRPIEERFFSSLRRIDITAVPTDQAEIKARHQSLTFRGYKKSAELSTEEVWVFEYDEAADEYEFHRRTSYVQLSVLSGQINPAQEARALRSISDARIAEMARSAY